MLGVPEKANGLSKRQAILFDSVFGNRTGVRKSDAKLLRFDARYPVLLQTRHPRPVQGNRGRKSLPLT